MTTRRVVAVGSLRPPKVEAVRRALALLREQSPEYADAEIVSRDVGVVAPAMPLSLDVLLQGSRARAQAVLSVIREEGRNADLGIGLEGGFDVQRDGDSRRGFLMSWAYVTDGETGTHGCGGALEVPGRILDAVLDREIELSEAIDEAAGQTDIRSRQGAWGILTLGAVNRTDSFVTAVVNALAPFYNRAHYPRP
jgi:inosine/xanthosine triphosphatase